MPFHSPRVSARMSQFGAGIGAMRLQLTAEQQTKQSWAKLVTSFSESPEIFRDSFERLTRDATRFPYAVLVPSHAGFLTKEKEKLVFCHADKVIVLEQIRGGLACISYRAEDVSYVQVGRALLQSWVKICGVTSDGTLASSEFRFNTVSDYLFTPIVERMRPAADCSTGLDASQERSKFDYINRLNHKLMNYARHSILPGEKVVQIILQPEIRAEILALLGKIFFRTLCASHLYILTDKELILLQDGVGKRWVMRCGMAGYGITSL